MRPAQWLGSQGRTQLPKLLGAAVARLPATMVLPAVAVLLFGLLPWESIALAWTAVALVGVIAVFGPPLQWPAWMMDISSFTQIPKLPGGNSVGGAANLALRCRAGDQHGRPGRTAAPRPRRPGPLPPGRRDPRPDRRLREL